MSQKKIIQLLKIAEDNSELASKLEATEDLQTVVDLGLEQGLNFSIEDIKAFREQLNNQNGELDDEVLEMVAGGLSFSFTPKFLLVGVGITHDHKRGIGVTNDHKIGGGISFPGNIFS